ncbi:uncharacterized protein KQ657_000054 [Scheffersomyces spartinae]|uniref:TauD/TfdA-like domain-containing protein n=1 Tax=Scheffersomyces spartinae TaxID=45513 RepID=A0A9P7VF09_9ASCO|nr:uncharacterized protein KQ657_000054 [Scheffersomyces spartinae]KAG7196046.1 hypothetical protein KQ657_000054 [Scheffersomyces spartinae]
MLTRRLTGLLRKPPLLGRRPITVSSYDNDKVCLVLGSGKAVAYNTVFLRDSCTAPESIDKFSQQKLFTTSEISQNLRIEGLPQVLESATGPLLKIVWNQNGQLQTSTYTEEFLEEYSSKENIRRDKFFEREQLYWSNKELVDHIDEIQIDYGDYITKEKDFFKACYNLNRYGICFVNNTPRPEHHMQVMTEDNATSWPVYKLAEKFGYIKKTFYGTLFDVKNVKKAINIAYTKSFLPLHMDLLYYESPPGLQLLHFIDNSTSGGENIFSDSFKAALYVKQRDPEAYQALLKVPITYHYDNNNEYYYYSRPLIVEDKYGIKEVNFAPSFQGPFEFGISDDDGDNVDSKLFQLFLRGFNLFDDFVNDPKNHYQLKVPEGSTVIFDNRRVLHSRLAFSDENGGDRWLMGTYVDGDSFRSKLRVGHRKFY